MRASKMEHAYFQYSRRKDNQQQCNNESINDLKLHYNTLRFKVLFAIEAQYKNNLCATLCYLRVSYIFSCKKAMKRKLLLCISVLVSLLDIYAQEGRDCTDYDFSPQAFSMIKNGSIQPDLNTGTLNVTIPVYVWEDADFRIPVQLCYSTNGFKPARQTGVVGLGWSCSVGGVITRQIAGFDDFNDHYGYYNKNHNYTNEELYEMEVDIEYSPNPDGILHGGHDTNPDVFRFNFLNHSGSFLIDDDGSFKVFNSNGERGCYDITYSAGSTKKFTIKTNDGYEYHFGSSYNSKEILYLYNPIYLILNAQENVFLNDNSVSVIAWHLDEIVAPNGRRLTLNYTSQSPNCYRALPNASDLVCTTFARGFWGVKNKNPSQPPYYIYKYPSITTISYINNIKFHDVNSPEGQIIMSFDYTQKDHKEIDTSKDHAYYTPLVTLQNKLDKIYFYNHGQESLGELSLSYIYNNTRMLLDQIYIRNIGRYKFTYNMDKSMPGILTNAQDFWGFYNGISNSDEDIDPTTLNNNYDESVSQNFMNPNSVYSKLGTLKSITYPTGGRTEFEYEANTADKILLRKCLQSGNTLIQFLPSLSNFDNFFSFQECGGVRIKSISDYNDTTLMYRRTYSYNIPGTNKSSGIVLKFNKYRNVSIDIYSKAIIHMNFPDNSMDKLHMAYSYVTEHFPDESFKVYRFTDYSMYPDEFSSNKKNIGFNVEYTSAAQENFMNNIFREPDSRHYRRGLLKSIEDFSSNGDLLFKKEYEYVDSDNSFSAYIVGSGKYWWSARRFTCDYLIKNIKETDYRNGLISTNHKFTYNTLGQIRYEAIMDGENRNGKGKYYRYCNENSLSFDKNRYKKAPSDIVMTAIRNGVNYVIGNIELKYDSTEVHNNPILIKEYCIDTPVSFSNIANYNLIMNIGRGDSYVSTLYSYNNLFRLTNVVSDGNRYTSYTWDNNSLNIVQKNVNNVLQTFTYTWKDMVGLTRVTEPSGASRSYQYDSLNRLESIKNSQEKTTHRYFYNIKNQ